MAVYSEPGPGERLEFILKRSLLKSVFGVVWLVCLVGAKEAPAPDAVGGVFRVNDSAVISSEIIEAVLGSMRERLDLWHGTLGEQAFIVKVQGPVAQASMGQVYNLLLYQHAQRDFSQNDNYEAMIEAALEEQRKKMVHQYGGNEAEAHLRLREAGVTFEKLLEDFRRELVIASYRQSHFFPTLNITRVQMLQYYRKHLEEKYRLAFQIQFQLIDVHVDDDAPAARREAEKAHAKILAGENFSDLVAVYSDGFRKNQEGLWRPLDPESLSDLYQPVAMAVKKIGLGQTTGVIEGAEHYFIAKLIARQEGGVIPFSQAQDGIKKALTNEKWVAYRQQLDKTLLKKATLGDFEEFVLVTCRELYNRLGVK
jgi:parvulin-like peptidyl-prolyl isomerase